MHGIIAIIRYLSRDRKIHLVVWMNVAFMALLLVTIVIGFYLTIYSSTLAGNVANYDRYIEVYNRQATYVEYVLKNKERVEDKYLKISAKYSQPELVHDMRVLSEKARVRLLSTSYRDEKYDDVLIRHVISLSVKGNYLSIKGCLKELKELRGSGAIEMLAMAKDEPGSINADIQLSVFSLSRGP